MFLKTFNSSAVLKGDIPPSNKQNVSSLVEIGAGKILSGLNKRIDKELISLSIAEWEEIDEFLIKVE